MVKLSLYSFPEYIPTVGMETPKSMASGRRNIKITPGVVVHTYNPSTPETEVRAFKDISGYILS